MPTEEQSRRAWATMDYIEAHPERHNQKRWLLKEECGTIGCFAGITCLLAGDKPEWFSDGDSTASVIVSNENGDSRDNLVSERAAELLGLDWDFAEVELFSAILTVPELHDKVREIFGERPAT